MEHFDPRLSDVFLFFVTPFSHDWVKVWNVYDFPNVLTRDIRILTYLFLFYRSYGNLTPVVRIFGCHAAQSRVYYCDALFGEKPTTIIFNLFGSCVINGKRSKVKRRPYFNKTIGNASIDYLIGISTCEFAMNRVPYFVCEMVSINLLKFENL